LEAKVSTWRDSPATVYVSVYDSEGKRHHRALWKITEDQLDFIDAAIHGERTRRRRLAELGASVSSELEPGKEPA
jgi:hypothetical protein